MSTAMESTGGQITAMNTTAGDVSTIIKSVQGDMNNQITTMNDYRSQFVKWSYFIVVVTIAIAIALGLRKALFPINCGKRMRCLWFFFHFTYWLVLRSYVTACRSHSLYALSVHRSKQVKLQVT